MKLLRLTFSAAILLSVLIMSGCGDDDDPDPKTLIVAKWELTKAEPKLTPSNQAFITLLVSLGSTQAQAQAIVADLTDPDNVSQTGSTIEVKSDGKYKQTDDSGSVEGTWELSADGKTITLDKGTSEMQTATIAKLDGSAMELDFDYSGDVGVPTSSGLGFHVILTFKKV